MNRIDILLKFINFFLIKPWIWGAHALLVVTIYTRTVTCCLCYVVHRVLAKRPNVTKSVSFGHPWHPDKETTKMKSPSKCWQRARSCRQGSFRSSPGCQIKRRKIMAMILIMIELMTVMMTIVMIVMLMTLMMIAMILTANPRYWNWDHPHPTWVVFWKWSSVLLYVSKAINWCIVCPYIWAFGHFKQKHLDLASFVQSFWHQQQTWQLFVFLFVFNELFVLLFVFHVDYSPARPAGCSNQRRGCTDCQNWFNHLLFLSSHYYLYSQHWWLERIQPFIVNIHKAREGKTWRKIGKGRIEDSKGRK